MLPTDSLTEAWARHSVWWLETWWLPFVAVMHEAAAMQWAPFVQGPLQRIQHEARVYRALHAPAEDPLGIGIDDEGKVDCFWILAGIDRIVARRDGCRASCSSTFNTARSRTSCRNPSSKPYEHVCRGADMDQCYHHRNAMQLLEPDL